MAQLESVVTMVSGFCHRTLGCGVSWYVLSFRCIHPGQLGKSPCLWALEMPCGSRSCWSGWHGCGRACFQWRPQRCSQLAPTFSKRSNAAGSKSQWVRFGQTARNLNAYSWLNQAPWPADCAAVWPSQENRFPGRCARSTRSMAVPCVSTGAFSLIASGAGHCPCATWDLRWDAKSRPAIKHCAVPEDRCLLCGACPPAHLHVPFWSRSAAAVVLLLLFSPTLR